MHLVSIEKPRHRKLYLAATLALAIGAGQTSPVAALDPRIAGRVSSEAWWLGGGGRFAVGGLEKRRCRPRLRRQGGDERAEKLGSVFDAAAKYYELPAAYVQAVTAIESHYDPHAVSRCCARGLMQLMPATAREMGVDDAHDPVQNVWGGARFLRLLANRFQGDLVRTTAAYNAGPGAVEQYDGVPPYRETQRYVRRVLAKYRQIRHEAVSAPTENGA